MASQKLIIPQREERLYFGQQKNNFKTVFEFVLINSAKGPHKTIPDE